jgi:hypothetical protein
VGRHSRPPLKIPVPKTWANLGLEGNSIYSIDGAVSREIGDTMTAVTDHRLEIPSVPHRPTALASRLP